MVAAKMKNRAAAPDRYPQVTAELDLVEKRLKSVRQTLTKGDTLKYSDVERLGSAVSNLLARAASAAWD